MKKFTYNNFDIKMKLAKSLLTDITLIAWWKIYIIWIYNNSQSYEPNKMYENSSLLENFISRRETKRYDLSNLLIFSKRSEAFIIYLILE